MSLPRFLALLLTGLLWLAPARAYTPESGVWWNPAEPGTGVLLEIQDNFLFAAAYTYDSAGRPTWYTTAGFLDGNARFTGVLDAFSGGNCHGCPYRPNRENLGAGGPISIVFNGSDPTRATLTWGGRSMPIERFQFYLKRPEDEQALRGVRIELTKTLGEWQSVLDFTDNPNADFQFYGDVAVLDVLTEDSGGDFVDGCRPSDSLQGFCTDRDASDHRAVIEYDSRTGEHVMVVDNSRTTLAAYFLEIGTNDFTGEVSVYNKGSTPQVFFPVRGHRTASRSFVQEGVGPSKDKDKPAKPRSSELPIALFEGEHLPKRSLDKARSEVLQRLEARLK
jgi:hypothetical protein